MIRRLQQGMKEDGFEVPMTKRCRWFEVPRRADQATDRGGSLVRLPDRGAGHRLSHARTARLAALKKR